MIKFFKVLKKSKKSKARLGLISTPHGKIQTPAFVPVATKGTLKSLIPYQLKKIGIQAAFVNTYHLVSHPGADVIAAAGGIHNFSRLDIPLMSDSGGFQVFSLAKRNPQGSGNPEGSLIKKADIRGEEQPLIVKISDGGVKFRSLYDGRLIEFTPEKSMQFQQKIGADIIMAFDECTYYPAAHAYSRMAMIRTHNWLNRCIAQNQNLKIKNQNDKSKLKNNQFLYGIIQGGTYEDLRKGSAKFVTSQGVDGVAIGGVSVGETKKEMRNQVKWVSEYLPKDKPVHLLGVGHIDDIADLVKYGIDTFDCVEPTRLARLGQLYRISNAQIPASNLKEIDILTGKYKFDLSPVDEDCACYTCKNFTKAYLHHLFKQKELTAYTLATVHNLCVMERLMTNLRKAIAENKI